MICCPGDASLHLHVFASFGRFISIFITRNSSWDEVANVNFLYEDIVHALKILSVFIKIALIFRQYLRRFNKYWDEYTKIGRYSVYADVIGSVGKISWNTLIA